jgi:hypothetical protein
MHASDHSGFIDMSHPYLICWQSLCHRAIPVNIHLENQAKLQHWLDQSHTSSPYCTPYTFQAHHLTTNMNRSSSANPARLKRLIQVYQQRPTAELREAMFLAKYSAEEIADAAFRCFIQRALPDGCIKRFRAHVAGLTLPPPPPPDCSQQHHNCVIYIAPADGTPSAADKASGSTSPTPAIESTPPPPSS